MAITLSAVLLFGLLTTLLIRTGKLSIGAALCAALFGFALASTNLAPAITHALTATVTALHHL